MKVSNPQTPSLLGLCNTCTHTYDKKNTNSLVCDSKTTLEGLDHQHIWWLEKATTSTTPNLEILQGIISLEDMRELFGYKTLNLQKRHKMHSNISKKPYKNLLRVSFIYYEK